MVQPYDGHVGDFADGLAGARVLVTGGAGFIGTRLVRALAAAGAETVVADLHPHPDADVRSVVGDLRDPEVQRRALTPGTDAVVHLAAMTSVLRSMEQPAQVYQTNVAMTADLLELARETGTRTFLFASTNAVTGDVGDTAIDEGMPLRPLTPYGATKAAAEMLLSAYTASYGMRCCALRFANVYGPGMARKDSMVPRLMRAARSGAQVEIYGDGKQARDFVHVDDVIQAILLAWRTGHVGPLIVGSGRSVSVNELVDLTRRVTGAPLPTRYVPAKPGEMPAVVLDVSAARALGFRPRYDLEAGLATVWPEFSHDLVAGAASGGPAR